MDKTIYANDVPYWKTSRSSPDSWIEKTRKVIKLFGGTDITEAFGSKDGKASYAFAFQAGGDSFRIVWPVLAVKNEADERSARVQAATLLYHDCKARAVSAKVFGVRSAFVGNLVLENSRTVNECSDSDIAGNLKPLVAIGFSHTERTS